jgi:hypothetical protein
MALWELEELSNPTFLGFIRSVPEPEEFLGSSEGFLPNRTVPTLEYEYILGAGGAAAKASIMAHVMGWDSEAPIASRRTPPNMAPSTVRGELPPIKRKAKLSEKEIIKYMQPRPGTSDRADVLDYIYDTTTELVTAVQARMEWLRMQAISEDRVKIDQEGVDVEIDFGVPTTQQYDINTDDNLSVWWEDTTNSNPISDLDYVCNQYEIDHMGVRPTRMIADVTTQQVLLNNVNLRDLARGPGAPTFRLTVDELNALFQIYQLPTLQTYDVTLLEEDHNGSYVTVRPFNRRKAVLLPPTSIQLGNTLIGPTAESRNIPGVAYTPYAPGIVGSVYGKDEPPSEWVKVAAVAFPTLPGAEFIVQMTVRNDLT